MGERPEIGGHKGVHMVVRVDRQVVETDARNFDKYQYLRNFNPYLIVVSRIIDHMIEDRSVVLTARQNGGPVEVYANGVLLDAGSSVDETSLGLSIRLFCWHKIKDAEQAEIIAKKVVRDGKAVVFEMVSSME